MFNHHGEDAVRARLSPGRSGPDLGDTIPDVAGGFLADQPLLVVGAADPDGRMWATVLAGAPGFLGTAGEHTLLVDAVPRAGDPLEGALGDWAKVGTIAIEPGTRRRMRINGTSHPVAGGLRIEADQVYSNCPKYISKREPTAAPITAGPATRGTTLTAAHRDRIGAADAFFVATADERGNADASHRGGNPGFVTAPGPDRIRWPEYVGNAMYMTLGNLVVHPAAGLLFPDWDTGAALLVSGEVTVDFDHDRPVLELAVTAVVDLPGAIGSRWTAPEYFRHNPPVTPSR